MADTTTELEVLDQIVDVLGGQSGQYETVVPTLQQILALLGGEGGSGYNPSLSVGRADALTGADSTAQWATRESTGSGAATVRNVQGASVVWNQYVESMNTMSDFEGITTSYDSTTNLFSLTNLSRTANYNTGSSRAPLSQTKLAVAGHKYLIKTDGPTGITATHPYHNANLPANSVFTNEYAETFNFKVTNQFDFATSCPVGSTITFHMCIFDLTTMFGAGNEPQSVAEFERMYPAPYYPYSAPTLKPVQIAGIRSTDAQGGELDSVEWPTQTLRAAGSVADMLYADHVDVNVGVVDMGTLTWRKYSTSGNVGYYFAANIVGIAQGTAYLQPGNLACARYTVVASNWETNIDDKQICKAIGVTDVVMVKDSAYTTAADFKAAMNGVMLFYELATPTTTPISPALPMTYKVQQGGSESIIVPDGEISAAPLITLAEGESAAELVMDALAAIAAPDGPTATANHAINTYLTMGGKLYKVTRAIAAGETIAAGTNVTQTTVMAELIARTA